MGRVRWVRTLLSWKPKSELQDLAPGVSGVSVPHAHRGPHIRQRPQRAGPGRDPTSALAGTPRVGRAGGRLLLGQVWMSKVQASELVPDSSAGKSQQQRSYIHEDFRCGKEREKKVPRSSPGSPVVDGQETRSEPFPKQQPESLRSCCARHSSPAPWAVCSKWQHPSEGKTQPEPSSRTPSHLASCDFPADGAGQSGTSVAVAT